MAGMIAAVNIWWLIGDVLLIVVVAPAVVFFLNKVLRPVQEIHAYAHDILEHGVALTGTLDSVPALGRTRDLASQARRNAERYGAALSRLL
jgi:hypothetical protein